MDRCATQSSHTGAEYHVMRKYCSSWLLLVVLCGLAAFPAPLYALQCGSSLERLETIHDLVSLSVPDPAIRDRILNELAHQMATSLLADSDALFEGTLLRTTQVSAPTKGPRASDFNSILYEFVNARWLKGPLAGLSVPRINLIEYRFSNSGLRQKKIERFATDPHAGKVWAGNLPSRNSLRAIKGDFGVLADLTTGVCQPLWLEPPENAAVNAHLEKALARLRKLSDKQIAASVKPIKVQSKASGKIRTTRKAK